MSKSRTYLGIEGMVWPDPVDPDDVEWSLRYSQTLGFEVPRKDALKAASYINAYRALIAMPQRLRNKRIEQIKRASEQAERERS